MFFWNFVFIQRRFCFFCIRRQDVLIRNRGVRSFECWCLDFKGHFHAGSRAISLGRRKQRSTFTLALLWLAQIDVTGVGDHDVVIRTSTL